ncbi:Leucine rich repeat containing protein 10-like protein [Dinothrombium tinctorium]|uniref:Leucine rich repeat containing protein 10-like protein n=1 Tax=Dinothrombium tinctorium TaxID=1965070 RepID=A0A443QIA5_9ACAR|nr:Leucine rich repeat containing protein 10-like protein [Dinothrombium tinctorium]
MFIFRLLLTIFLTLFCDGEFTCPREEVLFPCNCDSEVALVMCEKNDKQMIEIENIMSNISEAVQNKTLIFELSIEGGKLTKLSEKSLGSLLYSRIAIVGTGLESLHKNVFVFTSIVTNYIDLERNNLNEDVFDALRSLQSLNYINLSRNKLTSIPSHAFRQADGQFQSGLKAILLAENEIHTISERAFFSLPHLYHLDLSENKLHVIGERAFDFGYDPIGSQIDLTIDLSKNKLHSNSFNERTLANIQRPLKLKMASNNFTRLSEAIFRPFLSKHKKNSIDLEANPLSCDCSSWWLHRNMYIYRIKVLHHVCKDSRTLWAFDYSEFKECDNKIVL